MQRKHSSDNAENIIIFRKLGWLKIGFVSNIPEPTLSPHIPFSSYFGFSFLLKVQYNKLKMLDSIEVESVGIRSQ